MLRPNRRLAIGVALLGAVFLALYAVPLLTPAPGEVRRLQSNVLYNLPAMAALVFVSLRAARSSGRERAGWGMLAVMLLLWQAADWLYAWYDYVLGREVPSPGLVDVLYYGGYLAFIAAIPLLVMHPGDARNPRWLLDAAIVIVVAGVLLSVELLRPLSEGSDGTRLAILAAMGYPLLDLALLTMLVISLYASAGPRSRRVLVLAAAVMLQIAADVGYVWSVAHGGYDNVVTLMDLGWIGAYWLLAVFAVMPAEGETAQQREHRPELVEIIAPYCAAVLLAGFTVVATLWSSPPPTLVVGTVGAIVLLSVRQTATMFENLRLFQELKDQTQARALWLQVQSDLGEAMMIIENGKLVSSNDACRRITGYTEEELHGLPNVLALVAPEDHAGLLQWFNERAAGHHQATYHEITLVRHNGGRLQLELAAMPDAGGALPPFGVPANGRVLVIFRDISARRRAQTALIRSEAVMRGTLEATADGILVVNTRQQVIHHNQRFAVMWGIPDAVFDGGLFVEILAHMNGRISGDDEFAARAASIHGTSEELSDEVRLRDGRVFERHTRPLLDGSRIAGRVWSFRDVTERERVAEANRQALIDIAEAKARLEEKSQELVTALAAEQERARRDPLTGCLNHGAISGLMQAALQAPGRRRHAVIMVDVDGMKAVNDTFGHLAGDRVLIEVAGALGAASKARVGRYGGDEFAVVLPGADRAAAAGYIEDVLAALERTDMRDETSGARIPVAVSLGLAVFPDDAETVADLVNLADGAMYSSKRGLAAPESGGVPLRRRDDMAVRLVSELIPLLTSPGALQDKLGLISRRLSEAAGYEGVRIAIFESYEHAAMMSASGALPRRVAADWEARPELAREEPMRPLLEQTRRAILVEDVATDERFSPGLRALITGTGIQSLLVVPMLWRDQVIGSIGAGRKTRAAFTPRDAQLLATIAGQITAIVRMATLVETLQETSDRVQAAQAETVMMLAAAAEAHDRTTGMHLVSIRSLACDLARELGYSDDDALQLGLAAVLHDIGKVSVPDSVLSRTGPLASDEWALMQQHTVWGEQFLAPRSGFELAARVARSHHERWDGSGYPDGLKGEQIPVEAAIVTVADSYDAMTHDRPYRKGRSSEDAVREIAANRGTQFSPAVVDAMLRLHVQGRLGDGHAHEAAAA